MKIKTANLTGAALDWAVAKCEGGYAPSVDTDIDGTKRISYGGMYPEWSTDWAYGGPIIEHECIALTTIDCAPNWQADIGTTTQATGPTPLIAAMRCYVASKMGDELNVPDELTN